VLEEYGGASLPENHQRRSAQGGSHLPPEIRSEETPRFLEKKHADETPHCLEKKFAKEKPQSFPPDMPQN